MQPVDKRLIKAVTEATREVFESLLGWSMRVDGFSVEKAHATRSGELNAIIGFSGTISGTFVLYCSDALAARVASDMLGSECAADSPDTKDAIGELLNMIAGTAKRFYSDEPDPFRISLPTIVSGTNFTVHVKVKEDDEVTSLGFVQNGESERVGLKIVLAK